MTEKEETLLKINPKVYVARSTDDLEYIIGIFLSKEEALKVLKEYLVREDVSDPKISDEQVLLFACIEEHEIQF